MSECMHCGVEIKAWDEGRTLNQWGPHLGPELPLCLSCGAYRTPTMSDIWGRQWSRIPLWWPCWFFGKGIEPRVVLCSQLPVMASSRITFFEAVEDHKPARDSRVAAMPCSVSLEVAQAFFLTFLREPGHT